MSLSTKRIKSDMLKHLYNYPAEVVKELKNVETVYRDLSVYFDFYCHTTGFKSKLVNISGTIAVSCKGQIHNLPITIWLHNTHPLNPPKCFVKGLPIHYRKPGNLLDNSSLKSSSYLCNWEYPRSHLVGLIEEVKASFMNSLNNSPQIADSQAHLAPNPLASSPQASSSLLLARPFYEAPGGKSDHAVKKKINSVKQVVDLFHDLHIDKVTNMFNLVTPSPKNQVAERVVKQGHHLFTYNNKIYPVQLKFYNEKDGVLAKNETGNSISTVDIAHNHQDWQGLPLIPVNPSKEKSELFQRLLSTEGQNFSIEDMMEVMQSGLNYESALRYLSHECPICSEKVSFSRVVTMTHCSCSFCENCFKNYFSSVIKEQSIVNMVCPICRTPNLKSHQLSEDITEYFNFLDIQIHHYLDEKTHELFQRKLRDRTLMEMENFRWCAHCSFGLLYDFDRVRMDCPSCNKSTCFQCKIPWEQQHEGISCEQFKMWKLQNNPEYQASALDIYLSKNGIECPNCRAWFDLSRGGCMHFNCQECQYQFCGGCRRPFKLGSACSFMVNCLTKGLHAHHPRNCFYYLRDWSVERMKQLLNMGNVPLTAFIADNSLGQVEGKCKVMEQRETSQGLKDEQCGRPSVKGYVDFCDIHLKQCFVELVNKNNLDPAVLYSKDEILAELQRWNISVPNQHVNETEEQFTQRLRNKILNELKLDNNQTVFNKNSGLLASLQSNVL